MPQQSTTVSCLWCLMIINSAFSIENARANESPIRDLAKNLLNLTSGAADLKKVFIDGPVEALKNPVSLLTSPADTLSKLLNGPVSVTEKNLNKATDSIGKVANSTSSVVNKAMNILPGGGGQGGEGHTFAEDYEDLRLEEMGLNALRRPRYYSRDCEFRIACEMGLKLKPMTIKPVTDNLKTNKLVNNLHNRYTRAFSYGLLNEDCKPYYCLLVQFFGGPKQMAKGLAELMNKIANPEFYD